MSTFLGIEIEQRQQDEFYLSRPGLMNKVLKASGIEYCNPNTTPTTLEQLGPDVDGKKFDKSWDYASIIGMLMYLANNTRPDIAYVVHACA